ncbi:hypothetical protein BB561_006480 [Smittium simulii]|uniref:Uncharacterized protein n=1 Tax=Smittium simulii TaxID=133385 RepID=A0A2T9Y3V3_9FUNG|nr:hypothetical protein BB561_006480 [Smittium simulii]
MKEQPIKVIKSIIKIFNILYMDRKIQGTRQALHMEVYDSECDYIHAKTLASVIELEATSADGGKKHIYSFGIDTQNTNTEKFSFYAFFSIQEKNVKKFHKNLIKEVLFLLANKTIKEVKTNSPDSKNLDSSLFKRLIDTEKKQRYISQDQKLSS